MLIRQFVVGQITVEIHHNRTLLATVKGGMLRRKSFMGYGLYEAVEEFCDEFFVDTPYDEMARLGIGPDHEEED